MKPQHEHDCETCTYLGSVSGLAIADIVDVYVHEGPPDPVLLARYGSSGPDYVSSLGLFPAFNPIGSENCMPLYALGIVAQAMLADHQSRKANA